MSLLSILTKAFLRHSPCRLDAQLPSDAYHATLTPLEEEEDARERSGIVSNLFGTNPDSEMFQY
jgi:hypothetical protein